MEVPLLLLLLLLLEVELSPHFPVDPQKEHRGWARHSEQVRKEEHDSGHVAVDALKLHCVGRQMPEAGPLAVPATHRLPVAQ